ncbi:Uncharacterised protein [Enterobacter cloacae]|nr:Uncharacterised protein [Enterobacter cloacae]
MGIERLERAPAQARLAQQLLHRFVQILLCGKPRIMRGNGPDQPRQCGFFNRLSLFDPVLQEPGRFCGLLVVRRRITDNQDIRLNVLPIMLQQPQTFCLHHQRRVFLRNGRNINDVNVIQHAVLNGQHHFAGQRCQYIDRQANGVKQLAVFYRMKQCFLCFRHGKRPVSKEAFAGQTKAVNQQTQRRRKRAGMAGLMQHLGEFKPLLG